MTMPRLPLVAALLLTACGSSGDEPAAGAAQEASAIPAPVVENIAGEYRVAGIDGAELDAPIGIAVSIGADTIGLEPCAGFAWSYRFTGGALETKRLPASADVASCEPAPEVVRAGAALAEATRVRRTSANGLEFSGGGRSILLFSQ
jgi:hypothetical protein